MAFRGWVPDALARFATETARMVAACESGRALLPGEIAQWAAAAALVEPSPALEAAVMRKAHVSLEFGVSAALHAAALMGPCPELDYARHVAGRLR